MSIPARISIVTLGVADLARSARFYTALGWERCSSSSDEIVWFRTADGNLGLFPFGELAADADLPASPRTGFGGITLAINVDSPAEATAAIEAAAAAGGTVLKTAAPTTWGGFSGYFADPDGYPWEVAHNPFFAIGPEGRVRIP
jgi:catechol 2,3-dioxygenase-like lactoylglutathione lyase family enzyme